MLRNAHPGLLERRDSAIPTGLPGVHMRHLPFWSLIFAAAVSLNPSATLSQARQSGGIGLTVFADRNFSGKSATLREDTPDFRRIGVNDMASSLQVGPGEQWEVCEHINYGGRCKVFSGSESDLSRVGWSGTISSARRVRGGRGVTPPAQPGPGGRGPTGLELFSRTSFGGDRRVFTGPEPDLRRLGFNGTAQSLRIPPGQTWQVCSSPNFVNCLAVNTDWRDLNGLGMSRRISSVRPWQQGGTAVSRFSLVLFDDRSYRGRSFRVDANTPNLQGFANRAQSVQVMGGSWELCERANFGGRCVAVSGDLPDLSSIGLARRVASVRLAATRR